MTPAADGPLFFVIAGELSGDAIGASLMRALRARLGPGLRFAGIGGPDMIAAGLDSRFPMEELSLVSLHEILYRLPSLLRRIDQTERAVRDLRPDALITIDCPKFSLRVARRVADLGMPLIHYVAPTVWAYAPGRARKIAAFLDHLLLLFPFERPYFDAVGLATTYVGPQVLESDIRDGDGVAFRDRHGIPSDRQLLCVLPGSRRSEVELLIADLGATVRRIKDRLLALHVVVPTVPVVAERVRGAVATWPAPVTVVEDRAERYDAMAASTAALAAAGTVTLELAIARVPTVVVGRVSWISLVHAVQGASLKYIALPNWIIDDEAMPEFFQHKVRPGPVAQAVLGLLTEPDVRARYRDRLDRVVEKLAPEPGVRPSDLAADAILGVVEEKRHRSGGAQTVLEAGGTGARATP